MGSSYSSSFHQVPVPISLAAPVGKLAAHAGVRVEVVPSGGLATQVVACIALHALVLGEAAQVVGQDLRLLRDKTDIREGRESCYGRSEVM